MGERRYTTRPAPRRPARDRGPSVGAAHPIVGRPPRRVELRGETVGAAHDGLRLDAWLRLALEPAGAGLTKALLRRAIVGGGVRVDGRVEHRAGRPLRTGQRVAAVVRVDEWREESSAVEGVASLRVLHEDAWIVAFDKPAGLPTVPTADARRASLVRVAERWLAERDGAAEVRLGVHQRLDATTSGVVAFTKSREADRPFARALAEGTVEKTYVAVVRRPAGGRLPSRLEGSVDGGDASPRPAITDVRIVEALGGVLVVEARPRTGRKHQIRIHLARAGAPLLGDVRYGGPAQVGGVAVPRVMLHARRLVLAHPVTGAPLAIEAALPPDVTGLLARLRGA